MTERYRVTIQSQMGPREGVLALSYQGSYITGSLDLVGYVNTVQGVQAADGTLHLFHPIQTVVSTILKIRPDAVGWHAYPPGTPGGVEPVSREAEKPSFFEKLATVIVDKRNLIFFLYACALVFCLFSRNWVSVCNDITEYLPETTETRQGLTLMEEEFTTFGTARVMVSHVTYEMAEELAAQIEQIEGVTSATFGSDTTGVDSEDSDPETPEDIAEYFKGADALISVTFDGEEDDEISLTAMAAIRELLAPYDYYIDSTVGTSQADSLASEMGIILAVAAVIIVLVLLLTSRSYAEIPVLLLTFIAAALLNLGTNFIFGEISFVSNSVTVVLQLALAIDYAIIMLHRFLEEREHAGDREACIAAVSAAIPSISASSLTTILTWASSSSRPSCSACSRSLP